MDTARIAGLERLVAEGEGQQLEFKKKAAHPEKVVRGLIAFANTKGGLLLLGVSDNGTLAGVPYPEEEILAVNKMLQQTLPRLHVHYQTVALSQKKSIVVLDVQPHADRPVFLVNPDGRRETFVRHGAESLKASFEMREIVRRSKQKTGTYIRLGEAESKLFAYLNRHASITLAAFRQLVPIGRRQASQKLVALVLANLLCITPNGAGDLYTRAPPR